MTSRRDRVLIPLVQGFEETEAIAVADALSRAGIQPVLAHAAADDPLVAGSHRISVRAATPLAGLRAEAFSGVFLPGGMPGARHLQESEEVHALVSEALRRGALIAAICAAPSALYAWGMLAGRRVTSHPSRAGGFGGCRYEVAPVVVDRPFITSRGPGTALLCGFTIVACLRGAQAASELASAMVADVPEEVRKEWDRWSLTS